MEAACTFARSGPHSASIVPLESRSSRRASVQHVSVLVSLRVYKLCWWTVLAAHTLVGVFVLFAGLSHIALSVPIVHTSTIALGISIPVKWLSGSSYVAIALLHFRSVVRIISWSAHARRLTLVRPETPRKNPRKPGKRCLFFQAYRRLRGFWRACFDTEGYIGINGPYFASALIVRECIEIVTQTYQAYTLSRLVATNWINRFAVASVVLNCWSTLLVPIVHEWLLPPHGKHHSVAVRRLLHLVADMYLDFVFGIILPVCVMVPYVVSYDWAHGAFPKHLLDDDVWLVNAVAESRQVLVTSYVDFCASLLPQVGIYNCLSIVKTLVRTGNPLATVVHSEALQSATSTATKGKESLASRLIAISMSAWGVVVLGLHIQAQYTGYSSTAEAVANGCFRYQRPWLTTKTACSVLSLNCYRRNISGSAKELDPILATLDRVALARLNLVHCSALYMPSMLEQFHDIYVIEVYNSTLVSWPNESAITHLSHPTMMTLNIRNSRLVSFPDALLRRDLPRALTNVGFYHCNITELPETLGDAWASSAIDVFGLEGSNVRRLPPSLSRVRWRILWLAGNQLDELPQDLLARASPEQLWVSGNPLVNLPAHVGNTNFLSKIYAENTGIAHVPVWLPAWLESSKPVGFRTSASFYGSPVCHDGSPLDNRLCRDNMQTANGVVPYEASASKYPL